MPHNLDLILTLTGGLTAALAFGFITQWLRLSPIVGYLLAGIVVGPFTPGFVANQNIASQSAEIGVILLMFGVGLHFRIDDLLAVRKVAIPGALVQIVSATALGAMATLGLGWSWSAGIVFGMAISVASTVVLTRVLTDNRELHTPTGHIAVGWLIVEDLFTVLVLVMLPALVGKDPDTAGTSVTMTLGIAVLKLAVLVLVTFMLGGRMIPRLLGYVARTGSRELFTLTVLVLALGIAVGSAKLFGASMALGAFLAGMIVGQSDYGARAASDALPMRDAFAVLFFVSVGMLFDPSTIRTGWPLMLFTLAIILIGKPVAALVVMWVLKKPLRSSLAVAVSLAQIGEFSFILAVLASSLGILPPEALNALVVGSILSITLNPVLYQRIDPTLRRLEKWGLLPSKRLDQSTVPEQTPGDSDRVVVVGFGPVGQTIGRILRENGFEVVVIEMNIDTVQSLHGSGQQAIYGDASQREILHHAGVETAAGLIISASEVDATEVVRAARELNPKIRILTRSRYLKETESLRRSGADAIFSSEGEIALSMAGYLMEQLGATDEQIERERDRVREELFQ
jgi:CPA2 family monovalent cation:H+ antiporter-2